MNCEGLTWEEWSDAAGMHRAMWIILPITEWNAWKNGEDPSDYRNDTHAG